MQLCYLRTADQGVRHASHRVSHQQSCVPTSRRGRSIIAAATGTALLVRGATSKTVAQAEQDVLSALSTARGRGSSGLSEEQRAVLQGAVKVLERDGGLAAPTTVAGINGKWRLLYTSSPGTASPIQNTFTGVDAFSVFQEVILDAEEQSGVRVNNIVDFGQRLGLLKVEAEASTDSRPIPGFEPRRGQGLALFGKSSSAPPAKPDMRIDFAFDKAAFRFSFLPFTIPYPVPFRILGDERKGWIDVTYLSRDCRLRVSRGNKGTLFILVKELTPRDRLADSIAQGDDEQIISSIEELSASSAERAPAKSPLASGTWRLLWSQQADNATWLQKWGTSQANSYQIVDAAAQTVQNRVELAPWFRVIANATADTPSGSRTGVFITDVRVEIGPLKFSLTPPKGEGRNPGFIDWLYLDEQIRITRGSLGSLFIHERSEQTWP